MCTYIIHYSSLHPGPHFKASGSPIQMLHLTCSLWLRPTEHWSTIMLLCTNAVWMRSFHSYCLVSWLPGWRVILPDIFSVRGSLESWLPCYQLTGWHPWGFSLTCSYSIEHSWALVSSQLLLSTYLYHGRKEKQQEEEEEAKENGQLFLLWKGSLF